MMDSRDMGRGADRGSRIASPEGMRRVPLLAVYSTIGVIFGLVTLALHPVARPLSNTLLSHALAPYAIAGVVFFGTRALVRDKLRWCRSCAHWLAIEPDGERVLRTRPTVRRTHGRLDAYNAAGQKTGYSRSQTVTRGIRETVAISMVCRHCGAKSIVKERRDK